MYVSANGSVIVKGNATIVTGTLMKWAMVEGDHIDVTQKMWSIHASVPMTRPGHAVTIGSRMSGMIGMTEIETETGTEKLDMMIATE
jgi:hypothetical protein